MRVFSEGLPRMLLITAMALLPCQAALSEQGEQDGQAQRNQPEQDARSESLDVPLEPLDPGAPAEPPEDEDVLPPREPRPTPPTPHQPLDLPMSGGADPFFTPRDDQFLVNQLDGAAIVNRAGEDIATAAGLVVAMDGAVVALLAEIGGFFGLGARTVALPWTRVDVTPGQRPPRIVVDMDREALENAPEFNFPGGNQG